MFCVVWGLLNDYMSVCSSIITKTVHAKPPVAIAVDWKYSLKMCLPSERQMSKITLAFILKSQAGDREF